MKKAKIVLSAVALFAVVGGAFAFKATKFGSGNVYTSYTTTTAGGAQTTLCSLREDLKITESGGAFANVYKSANPVGICQTPTFTRTIVVGD